MAYLFDDASSQRLARADALGLTAWPVTIAAWFYPDALVDADLVALSDSGVTNEFFRLGVTAGGAVTVEAAGGGAVSTATSSTTFGINAWHHACGVFAADASRSVYLNGGGKVTDTTSRTWAVDNAAITRIASFQNSTRFFSGRLAEIAVWSVALTDDEVLALSKGVSPLLIRPASLVLYLPLKRGDVSGTTHLDRWRNRYDFTEAGTGSPSVADHARVFLPRRGQGLQIPKPTVPHYEISTAALNLNVGTISGWFKPTFAPASTTRRGFWDSQGARHRLAKTANANEMEIHNDGRTSLFTVTGLWTADSWTHFLVLYNKTGNVQRLFIAGAEVSAASSSGAWGATALGSLVMIGAEADLTDAFSGEFAQIGFWNVELTAAEIAMLANGVTPMLVRPSALTGSWRLLGGGVPEFGTHAATRSGGVTKATHPRTFLAPGRRHIVGREVPVVMKLMVNGTDRSRMFDLESLRILDNIEEEPNTCDVEVFGFTPAEGEEVIVGRGSLTGSCREFRGTITNVTQLRWKLNQGRVVYLLRCVDWTPDLGNRLYTKKHATTSATTIAQDIMALAPSGFTSRNVEAGLQSVTTEFKFQKLHDALTQLARLIGAHWYIDEDKDLHFYVTAESTAVPLDVSVSNTLTRRFEYGINIDEIRNKIFVECMGTPVRAAVLAGTPTVPVDDSGPFRSSGTNYAVVGHQLISYTGKAQGGRGAIIGTAVTPTNAPTLAPSGGSGLSTGNYDYAVTFQTASGETLPGPLASIDVDSALATPPASIGAATTTGGSSGLDNNAQYSWKFTFYGGAGFETTPSPATNNITTATNNGRGRIAKAGSSSPPSGASRRWYRTEGGGSTYHVLDTSAGNPEGEPPLEDETYWYEYTNDNPGGAQPPGSNTLQFARVALSGIPLGPSGTTGRKIYRTVAGGTQLKLVTTIADNTTTTYTDSTPDGSLGANVPTSDTSGLSSTSGEVQAGASSIPVTATGPFESGGGWAFIGSVAVRYTGLSSTALTGVPASGAGSLPVTVKHGVEIVAAPILTGIPAAGSDYAIVNDIVEGEELNAVVVREDLSSQTTYGVREHYIQDRRLTVASAEARGDAELDVYATKKTLGAYVTEDPLCRSGKPVTVDMASAWGISGTFTIMRTEIYMERERPLPQRRVHYANLKNTRDLFAILRELERRQVA